MAAPHVSGVAALVIASGVASTPAEVRQVLQSTAKDRGPAGWDPQYGWGIVDAYAALNPVPNAPPVAYDDSAQTNEDAAVVIAVLENDSDPDGGPLTVTNLTQPTNGTAAVNADQTVTYTPNADFNDADSFTYTANDGRVNSNVATVTVTVLPVNDLPVAKDDSASTQKDTPITIVVLANDSDVEGDSLKVTNLTQPANGSAALNVDQTVTYAPNHGFEGPDSFTYTANDGTANSNVATVTVTVNPAAPTMHVEDITLTKQTIGKRWRVTASVLIADSSGNPVEGATVSGHWSGLYSGNVSGTTGSNGMVSFRTGLITVSGTVTFTVDNVAKSGWLYDPSQNKETSGSIAGASSRG